MRSVTIPPNQTGNIQSARSTITRVHPPGQNNTTVSNPTATVSSTTSPTSKNQNASTSNANATVFKPGVWEDIPPVTPISANNTNQSNTTRTTSPPSAVKSTIPINTINNNSNLKNIPEMPRSTLAANKLPLNASNLQQHNLLQNSRPIVHVQRTPSPLTAIPPPLPNTTSVLHNRTNNPLISTTSDGKKLPVTYFNSSKPPNKLPLVATSLPTAKPNFNSPKTTTVAATEKTSPNQNAKPVPLLQQSSSNNLLQIAKPNVNISKPTSIPSNPISAQQNILNANRTTSPPSATNVLSAPKPLPPVKQTPLPSAVNPPTIRQDEDVIGNLMARITALAQEKSVFFREKQKISGELESLKSKNSELSNRLQYLEKSKKDDIQKLNEKHSLEIRSLKADISELTKQIKEVQEKEKAMNENSMVLDELDDLNPEDLDLSFNFHQNIRQKIEKRDRNKEDLFSTDVEEPKQKRQKTNGTNSVPTSPRPVKSQTVTQEQIHQIVEISKTNVMVSKPIRSSRVLFSSKELIDVLSSNTYQIRFDVLPNFSQSFFESTGVDISTTSNQLHSVLLKMIEYVEEYNLSLSFFIPILKYLFSTHLLIVTKILHHLFKADAECREYILKECKKTHPQMVVNIAQNFNIVLPLSVSEEILKNLNDSQVEKVNDIRMKELKNADLREHPTLKNCNILIKESNKGTEAKKQQQISFAEDKFSNQIFIVDQYEITNKDIHIQKLVQNTIELSNEVNSNVPFWIQNIGNFLEVENETILAHFAGYIHVLSTKSNLLMVKQSFIWEPLYILFNCTTEVVRQCQGDNCLVLAFGELYAGKSFSHIARNAAEVGEEAVLNELVELHSNLMLHPKLFEIATTTDSIHNTLGSIFAKPQISIYCKQKVIRYFSFMVCNIYGARETFLKDQQRENDEGRNLSDVGVCLILSAPIMYLKLLLADYRSDSVRSDSKLLKLHIQIMKEVIALMIVLLGKDCSKLKPLLKAYRYDIKLVFSSLNLVLEKKEFSFEIEFLSQLQSLL